MNDQSRPSDLSLMKFGIGQPVPRKEDPTLVRGEGRYTDDVNLPGQAYAVFVRSPYAHGVHPGHRRRGGARHAGRARGLHRRRSRGGRARADAGACSSSSNRDGTPMTKPPRPALPSDKVRFVGEPVACVVAETLAQAQDAAEAVELDIEPLPAVTDAARGGEARRAAALRRRRPATSALDYPFRRQPPRSTPPSRAAAHVTRLELVNNRVVVNPMEPRAAIADYDAASERFTLHVGSPGRLRACAARSPRRPRRRRRDKVRVLTGQCRRLVRHEGAGLSRIRLHPARREGARPAGEVDRRALRQLPVRPPRPRPCSSTAELALDEDGHFLAVRAHRATAISAPISPASMPLPSTLNTAQELLGVYRTPLIEVSTPSACSPTPRRSAPIAAPAGPRATTTWSG